MNDPVPAGADPLGQTVRSLFNDLSLAGDAEPTTGAARWLCGEAGRFEHGTRVRFTLRVIGSRVLEVRYRAYGCPYTLACCEWLARRLRDAPLAEAPQGGAREAAAAQMLAAAVGTPGDWAAALGVPQVRLGRLLVIEDALRAALAPA